MNNKLTSGPINRWFHLILEDPWIYSVFNLILADDGFYSFENFQRHWWLSGLWIRFLAFIEYWLFRISGFDFSGIH